MRSSFVPLLAALVFLSAACAQRRAPAIPEGVAAAVMQQGERMRILTFEGSDEFSRSQIAAALDGAGIEMRLDSWIGPDTVSQTEVLLRQMFSESGYPSAAITHEINPIRPNEPRFVHLKFNLSPGPRSR